MKRARQHDGKTFEAPKKKNAKAGQTGVKRSTKKTCAQHKKGAGVVSAEQVSVQSPSNRGAPPQKTKTEVPALEVKTAEFHPFTKIKLQLFPVDKQTRKVLEKDGHNPFLELTLSTRKKISSILKHINAKWGTSNVAVGEPMLFPYDMQLESLVTQRWTSDDNGIRAGDVYAGMGCPANFRLRYGWLSNLETKASGESSTVTAVGACQESEGIQGSHIKKTVVSCDQREELGTNVELLTKPVNVGKEVDSVVRERMFMDAPVDSMGDCEAKKNGLAQTVDPWDYELTNLSIGGLLSEASLQGKIDRNDFKLDRSKSSLQPIQIISDVSVGGLLSEVSLQEKIRNSGEISNGSISGLLPTTNKGFVQSVVPWDESLTTLSIGGLLSEASLQGKINNADPKSNGSRPSDSFDAFVSSQFNSHPLEDKPLPHLSHSSILDAEETRHAFAFQKCSLSSKVDLPASERARSGSCSHDSRANKYMDSAEATSPARLA